MNRTRSSNNANAVQSASSMHFYDARIAQPQAATAAFTSTAKLPIETVKRLIAAVSRRPNLWIRQNHGQKRFDITALWQEVSEEAQLPADVCRIKWGHLRDNFRKVFIRNTLSDETPTTWRFYNDMRFMEKSVAENIMRQNRYKEQTRYWPEIQQSAPQVLHPMIPICTLKENVKIDAESMQSFGIYTETDEMESASKRIKQEPSDSFLNGHHDTKSKHHNNNYQQTDEPEHEHEHEPDDDDFDEDTATDENDHHPQSMHIGSSKGKSAEKEQLYPIEVFDVDDDDNTASSGHNAKPPILKGRSLYNGNSETFSSMEDHSNNFLKKTDSLNGLSEEHDSDRMFLLSLLPYLRNIDGNRKLHVRQKLQNVLIEELS